MADLSPEKIIEPISEDQPCGPDLEMEDIDYGNFMAQMTGIVSFERYSDYDPDAIDFPSSFESIDGFLDKSRDLRLLVLLAKLKILKGDLDGFVEALEASQALLKEHWADVHPAGDMSFLRAIELSTLDDRPTSVLPLERVVLFRSRRAGPITLRRWELANGEAKPYEDEEVVDAGTILSEIGGADAEEMKGLIANAERCKEAMQGIRTVCMAEGGPEETPAFEKVPTALDAIIEMIKKGTGADAETAVEEGAEEGGDADGTGISAVTGSMVVQMPTGDVATREDAIDALFAAERYYALHEPSSPNVLLLREARNAANKTFAELLADLLPRGAGEAYFTFGKEPWFEVPLSDINSRNPAPEYEGEETSSDSSWEDAGLDEGPTSNDEPDDDGWTSSNYGEAAAEEAAADSGSKSSTDDDGWTSSSYGEAAAAEAAAEQAADENEEAAAEPEASRDDADTSAGSEAGANGARQEDAGDGSSAQPKFVANLRPEALALIDKVRAYYRVAEPSSPVLLMLDRVVELASKNFIGVLREVLPEGHLRVKGDPAPPKQDSGW